MCLIASSARSGLACASFLMVLPEIVMTCKAIRKVVTVGRLGVQAAMRTVQQQTLSVQHLSCMHSSG